MVSPHDSLFRDTFGKVEHAGPLLRALLPATLVAAIDWESLKLEPTPQVDEQQRTQQTDQLFSMLLCGRPALLYVVYEHTVRPSRWLALRVLAYMVGIWKDLRRRRPAPRLLPPIIPVVVSLGRRRFRATTDLLPLLDVRSLPPAIRQIVLAATPHFTFVPHEFAGKTPAEVRAMGLSLLGLWTIAAQQFMAPVGHDDDAVVRAIAEWADVARRLIVAPGGEDTIAALSSYLLKTTKLGRRRLAVVFEQHFGEASMKRFESTYDRITRESKAEGKVEGKVEGHIEGRATTILRLLTRRFGELPRAVEERVRQGSADDLDRWTDRLLDAGTLDEMLAD